MVSKIEVLQSSLRRKRIFSLNYGDFEYNIGCIETVIYEAYLQSKSDSPNGLDVQSFVREVQPAMEFFLGDRDMDRWIKSTSEPSDDDVIGSFIHRRRIVAAFDRLQAGELIPESVECPDEPE
jgi:hypothetical protein